MTIYWYGDPVRVAGVAIKSPNATSSTTVVSSNHAVVSITSVSIGDEKGNYPGSGQWIRLPDGRETQTNQWTIMKDYVVNELRICTVDRPLTSDVLELSTAVPVGTTVKAFSNLTRTWSNYKISYISKDVDGNASIVCDGIPAQPGDSGGPVLTLDNKFLGSIMSSFAGGLVATVYPGIYGGKDPITWSTTPVTPTPSPTPTQPQTSVTSSNNTTPTTTSPTVNNTSGSSGTAGTSGTPSTSGTSGTSVTLPILTPTNLKQQNTVSTVADLIQFDPTLSQTVSTLGYWSVGDGGAGTYNWTSDQNNTNNGNKIKSAKSGSWKLTATTVNVLQWGAKNDGSTDAAPRINEAIAQTANFVGNREIYIPPGLYAIGSPINIAQNNTRLKLHGILRNINGVNSTVLQVYTKQTPNIVNGIPTYQLNNITIDGENLGVIDQNSQNATPWDANNPGVAYHALFAFNVDTVTIKNLTVKNGIIWSVCAELCKNVLITGNRVYTGFCNNRLVNGVPKYLGTQDGIHAVDCINTIISHNYVESGDDAIVVTATRSLAGNAVVDTNICWVKVFAYEKDGVTLNNNSVTGRFPLAVYCEAIAGYCGLENVVVSNNIVPGGTGLFAVYDKDTRSNVPPHIGSLNGVRFIGNSFNNINSPGNPNVQPYPVQMGWLIHGGNNIEFIGNTFNNIARWGNILYGNNPSGTNVKYGTITFRCNKFTNYNPPAANLYPGQNPAVLWIAGNGDNVIVENNTFENNNVVCVAVGGTGDLTPNKINSVLVNNNTFTNNTKMLVECYGVNNFRFVDNPASGVSTSPVLKLRAYKVGRVTDNTVLGVGNGALNVPTAAFDTANSIPTTELIVRDNSVYDKW